MSEKVPARPDQELVSNLFRVQVGDFSKKVIAEKKMQAVRAAGFEAFLVCSDNVLWRVQVGTFPERALAEKMQAKLMAAGFSGYVTRLAGRVVR